MRGALLATVDSKDSLLAGELYLRRRKTFEKFPRINWHGGHSDAWLIDDRAKSLDPFSAAGGNVIEFKGDWKVTLETVAGSMNLE